MQKLLNERNDKIWDLEYQIYHLKKSSKENEKRVKELEEAGKKSQEEIEKLLDMLYGVDKAKEFDR